MPQVRDSRNQRRLALRKLSESKPALRPRQPSSQVQILQKALGLCGQAEIEWLGRFTEGDTMQRTVRQFLTAATTSWCCATLVYGTQTWYVDAAANDPAPDGSQAHPFPLVQAALDVAQDGDTVLVLPGTYFQPLDFLGKDLTLVGRDSPAATILDGNNFLSVITFANGETRNALVTGFTITHGLGTGNGSYNIGGGIRVYRSTPTIR